MPRYCKICGAKSGRCNHLVLDLGESEGQSSKKESDSENTEKQK